MRKFYNKFFHISKNGKIREEVMLMRVATTVIVMVMCLAAMSFSAYAYFSYSLTTGPNIIEAAIFDIDVSITDVTTEETIEIINNEAELKADTTYEITVKHDGTATTGFAKVTIGSDKYYTQQLFKSEEGEPQEDKPVEMSFTVTTGEATTVTFEAYWGTSSAYADGEDSDTEAYITNGRVIDLSKGVSPEPEEETTTAAGSETATEPTTAPEAESTPEPSTEAAKSEEPTKPTEAGTTGPSAPAEEPDTTQPTEVTTESDDEPTEPVEPAAEDAENAGEPTDEISE